MGMKKESKKKSRKEKKEEESAMAVDDVGAVANNAIEVEEEEDEKPKKKKKPKKENSSKKRGRDQVDVDDSEDDADGDSAPSTTTTAEEKNKPSKEERKAARAAKKSAQSASKSDLLEQIPKLDSDGIPFNKIQIRRMLRRVKHGLDPIATEEEEREIRQREKREKVEEEALYAADADQNEEEDEGGKEESTEDKDDITKEDDTGGEQRQQREENEEEQEEEPPKKKKKNHNPPSKGTKRAKPVPPGYICMACKNAPPTDTSDFSQIALFTPHWIYDCPMKKTNRGCNQVAKKLRGLHDPPSQKVFVSGLPFECDEGSVKRYFEDSLQQSSKESGTSVELVHCKLLKFEDSKRCKGTAFLTFDSDDAAKLALKMNGSFWREVEEPGTKTKSSGKKKGGGKNKDEGGEKKELKLRVSKVLNRHVTKQKRGGKS